jgi:hypothetical protein
MVVDTMQAHIEDIVGLVAKAPSTNHEDCLEVEMRWMTSGEAACVLNISLKLHATDKPGEGIVR